MFFMKLKCGLIGLLAFVTLVVAAPHTWVLKTGESAAGDYVSSGTTTLVIKTSGTNSFLKISDLSTNDLAYLAKMQAAQRQARFDAEARQMVNAGMVELTANLIRDFPEKVDGRANGPRSWMDAKFINVDSSFLANPDFDLGFEVEHKNGDIFEFCSVQKEFYGEHFMNGTDYSDKKANPLVGVVMDLKRGDKVRLIGRVIPISSVASGNFKVEKVEMIESAAEKKAKEQLDAAAP